MREYENRGNGIEKVALIYVRTTRMRLTGRSHLREIRSDDES